MEYHGVCVLVAGVSGSVCTGCWSIRECVYWVMEYQGVVGVGTCNCNHAGG